MEKEKLATSELRVATKKCVKNSVWIALFDPADPVSLIMNVSLLRAIESGGGDTFT